MPVIGVNYRVKRITKYHTEVFIVERTEKLIKPFYNTKKIYVILLFWAYFPIIFFHWLSSEEYVHVSFRNIAKGKTSGKYLPRRYYHRLNYFESEDAANEAVQVLKMVDQRVQKHLNPMSGIKIIPIRKYKH